MTFTLREQEWRMDVYSRKKDHAEARKRASDARDAHMLLTSHIVTLDDFLGAREEKREANRLYAEVYLRVRQELKAARAAKKERHNETETVQRSSD